jgi:hypothetical protein
MCDAPPESQIKMVERATFRSGRLDAESFAVSAGRGIPPTAAAPPTALATRNVRRSNGKWEPNGDLMPSPFAEIWPHPENQQSLMRQFIGDRRKTPEGLRQKFGM